MYGSLVGIVVSHIDLLKGKNLLEKSALMTKTWREMSDDEKEKYVMTVLNSRYLLHRRSRCYEWLNVTREMLVL